MKAIRLNIINEFRQNMSPDELYKEARHEVARFFEHDLFDKESMDTIKYVLVVVKKRDDGNKDPRGKVEALYKIDSWDTLDTETLTFVGEPADNKLLEACLGKKPAGRKTGLLRFFVVDLRVFMEFAHGIQKEHVESALNYLAQKGRYGKHDIRYAFEKALTRYVLHGEVKCGIKEVIRIAYCYSIGEQPNPQDGIFIQQQYDLFNLNSAAWPTGMGKKFLTRMGFYVSKHDGDSDTQTLEYDDDDDAPTGENDMEIQQLRELLEQFHQIILYGPPGTGKTYSAKKILRELLNVKDEKALDDLRAYWNIVQFHPSYNYEDFVRGIQVKTEEKRTVYEIVNRVFGNMCADACKNPNKPYVLIIDEINRANVSAVLGELIYALEYRGAPVKTPYLGDIIIPPNLYIIGTMNTADRTIGQIDYAVRRRFAFVPCLPERNII